MSIEAMKQAVNMLIKLTSWLDQYEQPDVVDNADKVIDALCKAIEQAETQEHVTCQHKRYSVDVHEQTGTCYDCGAEGRMRFVVNETAPPQRQRIVFPTSLRKMWSGSDVQQWLDANVNGGNHGT